METNEKKFFKIKKRKIKKIKKIRKGEQGEHLKNNNRRYFNEQHQCMWHGDKGIRCKKFKMKDSIYCEHHEKTRVIGARPIDFDLYEWVKENKISKNEKVISLDEYPASIQIWRDKHPDKVIMKSAQVGITEWGINFALAASRIHKGFSTIYTLPSRGLASSVSKQRIDSLCVENEKAYFKKDKGGKFLMRYDSVLEKQIGRSFLFLQGTWTRGQAISTPADMLIHDEVDDSKRDVMTKFRSRIGNSDWKWKLMYGTPTYAEFGIHKEFLETDQHHWWYKCEHCGHIFKLCCAWPDILFFDEESGEPYFGCPDCEKEISRKKGWWKPEVFGARRRGYHITKLCSPRHSAQSIVDSQEDYRLERDFVNYELGLPFTGDEDKLNERDLDACEDGRFNLMFRDKLTCMGVDQGGDDLWVIVLKHHKGKKALVYVDHLTGENAWKELHIIMNQMGVMRCVIDGLPNVVKAKEFASTYKKRVFLCYYQDKARESVNWQPKKNLVTVNRNLAFEYMFQMIRKQELILPVSDKITPLKNHLLSLIRQKVETTEGEFSYIFKKVKQDHLAHALNYALTAAENMDLHGGFRIDVFAKNRITEPEHSDRTIDILARFLIKGTLTRESLLVYRAEKTEGRFVADMPLNDKDKKLLARMENKFTVANLLSATLNFQLIENRKEDIEQSLLLANMEDDDDE